MCGICGSLALDSSRVAAEELDGMLHAMVHRGPDAGGSFTEPGIAAGIRRLAVIDVHGGNQPISNEDGTVTVVFNGEIYNHDELRQELSARGHRFRTRSDTEVLVHLWEEHGADLVQHLNGMFAFCLHDSRTRESFIARDRLGIKPLFYARVRDRLVFASEIGVLLRHESVGRGVDMSALPELFSLQYTAGDRTVYRSVRKLLPGHAIHVKGGELSLSRYFEIPRFAETDDMPVRPEASLIELLTSSIRYRMISDVPLGMFLSGGLDSAAVLQVAAGLSSEPIRTFSLGFDDAAAFDERRYARGLAEHFRTEHHELVLSPIQLAEHLPRLVEHLAEPVMDPAMIPTYVLSEFARRHVTVVLTGEGADELFAGYRRYLYQSRYGWLGRVPGIKAGGGKGLRGLMPRRVDQALGAVAERDPVAIHLEWAATVGQAQMAELFAEDVRREAQERIAASFAPHFEGPRLRLRDQLRADQHEWLPQNLLAKVDRATMAVSLEARVPFLDHRIVEWCARLPDDLKIHGNTTKVVLRRAFAERLPKEVLARPKRGFDLPLAAWIRGPLRPLVSDLFADSHLARWEGLNGPAAKRMLRLHLDGAQDFGLPLFNLLSVLIFLDQRCT